MTAQQNDDGDRRRIAIIRHTITSGDDPYERCLTRYAGQLLLRELDEARSHTTIYRNQRDGAYGSILLIGEALATLAAFQLADNAEDPAWNIVNTYARQLLALGLLPPAAGSTRHDEDTEPDLSQQPIGEIDV